MQGFLRVLGILATAAVLAGAAELGGKGGGKENKNNRPKEEEKDTVARIGDVIAEAVVQSQGLNVDESSTGGVERVVGRIDNEPYLNTYQINHKPYSWKNQGLDIIGINGNTNDRPVLGNLAQYGDSVTTPEELLDLCCQYPACYDPLYELCIDTCRKCETVYPVTSWLPCPPLLNIPDCTSPTLSYTGALPLACYPDIGPFGNIIPLESILAASRGFQGGARNGLTGGQAYRSNIRDTNRKQCSDTGICRSAAVDSRGPWGR